MNTLSYFTTSQSEFPALLSRCVRMVVAAATAVAAASHAWWWWWWRPRSRSRRRRGDRVNEEHSTKRKSGDKSSSRLEIRIELDVCRLTDLSWHFCSCSRLVLHAGAVD